jgi:lysyl-tRNA synthetase class 2
MESDKAMTFENDQVARRYEELEEIEASGLVAYPYSWPRTHSSAAARSQYQDDTPELRASVAGRIVAIRRMGKATFIHIQDDAGRLQIYLKRDDLEAYDMLKLFDIGDIVGFEGYMFRTRTGEVTLHAAEFALLTKCLSPLPVGKEEVDEEGNRVVHDQFADKELRYRQRYIDLTVNPDIREVFRKRARAITMIRQFLDQRGYLEVETPVLHAMYGGAAARPFSTHLNALDIPLYLRISLELNLKRLMVGGFEGVYELGKNFRNEGIDKTHNPEFTMLELYVAYHDYIWMLELMEKMLTEVTLAVNGSLQVATPDGTETIDFTPPYRRATMHELITEKCGENIEGMSLSELRAVAAKQNIHTDATMGIGRVIDEIFSALVQPTLIQPTFVMDFPEEMVPLAKRHRSKPGLVENWELIIFGREIAPCFSELNDPREQRRRFEEQATLRAAGDDEAMLIDEDFLRALEVGMPPTAGVGLGIDRLVMILTGEESIRDVVFFPMMRPE